MSKESVTKLSIVVPAYNEQEVLPEFRRRVAKVLDGIDGPCEIVFVNDGSKDNTINVMHQLRELDPRISIIDLSRNFGKEIALTAGLDFARGEAVVVIDADLQDPPELIPEMIKYWKEGADVVYARRSVREGETWFKKTTAKMFYRLLKKVSRVDVPEDTGDFRLLSRRALEALKQLRERHRYMKGLFAWIGFPAKAIYYKRDPRFAGVTKWNYFKLWGLALEGFTSFTTAPLKVATYVGAFVAMAAFLFALFIIYKTIFYGDPVAGYPSLMVVVLFIGGIQLVALGVIGEYLGRMFMETKLRPLYLVKDYLPSQE